MLMSPRTMSKLGRPASSRAFVAAFVAAFMASCKASAEEESAATEEAAGAAGAAAEEDSAATEEAAGAICPEAEPASAEEAAGAADMASQAFVRLALSCSSLSRVLRQHEIGACRLCDVAPFGPATGRFAYKLLRWRLMLSRLLIPPSGLKENNKNISAM